MRRVTYAVTVVAVTALTALSAAGQGTLGMSAEAQRTLGALLDAGGVVLSPDEFRAQLVQRTMRGNTPIGYGVEVMYTADGFIRGQNVRLQGITFGPGGTIDGEWKVDDAGRICSSFRLESSRMANVNFAPRCQYWYKLQDKYFISDSDTDRQVKVFMRTVVP